MRGQSEVNKELEYIEKLLSEAYYKLKSIDTEISKEHYTKLGLLYNLTGCIRSKCLRMMGIANRSKTIGLLLHNLNDDVDRLQKTALVIYNIYEGREVPTSVRLQLTKAVDGLRDVLEGLGKLIGGDK